MTLESKLTAKVEAKGAKEAAEAIRSVGTAQEEVAGKAKGATNEVKDQTKEQIKLNAAEGDFISLLSNVNPQMGLYGDLVLKATKVLNTAGDSTVSLTQVMGGLRNVLRQNIGALKFFAAGGAVIGGLVLIGKAFEKIRQEAEAAKKAFEALDAAADKATRNRQTTLQNLAQETAKKRGGVLTEDQIAGIEQQVDKARKSAPNLSEDSIIKAAASLGPGAKASTILQGAVAAESFGFQFTDEETPERQRERLETTVRRTPGIDKRVDQVKRDAFQKQTKEKANLEVSAQGGGTAAIQAFGESLPGDIFQGKDPELISKLVKGLANLDKRDVEGGLGRSQLAGKDRKRSSFEDLGDIASALAETGDELDTGEEPEANVRTAQIILNQLRKKPKQQQQPNITINNNNVRNTTPGPNRNRQTGERDANERETDF